MTETVPPAQSSSLRRLVPRIFSRSARRDDVEQLLRTVRTHHPKGDLSIIERAYAVADEAHDGSDAPERRAVHHPPARGRADPRRPRAWARRRSPRRSCTTRSRTPATRSTTLKAEFGDEVAMLVDGVTKLDKVKYGESAQAETVRKMIVAMSRDIRVLLIKLADRLHNARTWGFVPPGEGAEEGHRDPRDLRAARAPARHPDDQVRTRGPVVRRPASRSSTPRSRASSSSALRSASSTSTTSSTRSTATCASCASAAGSMGRPKQLYSVYQKMVVRGREFDDIYDLIGIRILVGSVRDCYAVLGAIHARWTPLPGRFKDYIATPKFNLYQSLHTTVIGPGGRTVEIQIRTQRDAPAGGVRRRGALEVQGAPDRRQARCQVGRRRHGVARAHLGLAGRDGRPRRVPRLAALRDRREGGLRLHAEGPRDRASRPARRPSTSPTPCTPRSATARWARRSTDASCRSSPSCRAATSSRSSPRRTRMPAPARTG